MRTTAVGRRLSTKAGKIPVHSAMLSSRWRGAAGVDFPIVVIAL